MYGGARALCFALFEILTSSFKQFLRVPAPRHVSPFLRLFLRCPALASRFSSRADAQLLPASHRLRASSCLPVKSFSLFFFPEFRRIRCRLKRKGERDKMISGGRKPRKSSEKERVVGRVVKSFRPSAIVDGGQKEGTNSYDLHANRSASVFVLGPAIDCRRSFRWNRVPRNLRSFV